MVINPCQTIQVTGSRYGNQVNGQYSAMTQTLWQRLVYQKHASSMFLYFSHSVSQYIISMEAQIYWDTSTSTMAVAKTRNCTPFHAPFGDVSVACIDGS